MSCKKTKCKNPECTTETKKCKMKNGLCPACYQKTQEKLKP